MVGFETAVVCVLCAFTIFGFETKYPYWRQTQEKMAVSDVVPQNGGHGNVKLHPYLITLVRWCVSCLWGSAHELLRRLLSAPLPRLPQITAGKPPPRVAKPRAASSEHLHPEPRVDCAVLHAPAQHDLDVIFVHGLYGSLGNTWRQGEWRNKYKLDPTKVPLRSHSSEDCTCTREKQTDTQEMYAYEANLNETNEVTFNQINGCFEKVLPNEHTLTTENFYNNTVLQVDVDQYETQAQFVTEMFKNGCDNNCDDNFCNFDNRCDVECKCKGSDVCRCKGVGKECEAGCGCVCDACYSPCWPRDWVKEDFPGARVISVNYTSDPYLWRPLWVKENKRLQLHERADQMMQQLLALGVGQRPIVWVGHSKGGLFIKQIYCDAYESHLKLSKSVLNKQGILNNNSEDQSDREYIKNNVNRNVDNKFNSYIDNDTGKEKSSDRCNNLLNNFVKEHNHATCITNGGTHLRNVDEMNEIRNNNNSGNSSFNKYDNKDVDINCNMERDDGTKCGWTQNDDVLNKKASYNDNSEYIDISVRKDEQYRNEDFEETRENAEELSSNIEERARAALWAASSGFMFYSVPHRGSPLADIKAPLTRRSVELMEIAKDCPLVLELQARWLEATQRARPLVRSLVETGRTLMCVLWLRIVSADSADAGVGELLGVSVDHREICKPASRRCLLYTELTRLIRAALQRCSCR